MKTSAFQLVQRRVPCLHEILQYLLYVVQTHAVLPQRAVWFYGFYQPYLLVVQWFGQLLQSFDDIATLIHQLDVVLGCLQLKYLLREFLLTYPVSLGCLNFLQLPIKVVSNLVQELGLPIFQDRNQLIEVALRLFYYFLLIFFQT